MNKSFESEFFSLYSGANINGDDVIGFAAPSKIKAIQGYLDRPTVLESMFNKYDEKSHKVHLGMIELMATANNVRLPMMMDLLKTTSVLTVPEGGSVTYDLAIPRDPNDCAKVMVDTASDNENGGIYAGVPFKLILDKPFTAGDLLKPDPTSSFQVEVSRDIPVEPYGGGAYLHYVIYKGDHRQTFPTRFLREGFPWFKIGHKNGEYGTQFSTITMGASLPAFMTLQWTPSNPTTIEGAVTRNAANMATSGAKLIKDSTLEKIGDEMIKMGGYENRGAFISAKTVVNPKTGKEAIDMSTVRVDDTLEYLMMAELHKMESWTNMFATAYVDHGSEGVIKVNDGLWAQWRRGKIIEYSRPGGITLADLQEASSYYYGNSGVPVTERKLKFKGGEQATLNIEKLINRYATQVANNIPQVFLGSDALLAGSGQKLVTGDLGNLSLNVIPTFKSGQLPGVGLVEVEHDPSFDWNMGTTNAKVSGFVSQGLNRNTYTLVLDSIGTRSNKNTASNLKGAKLVDGGKTDSPIYLVQPDHPYVTWGRAQGRMNNGRQFTNVQSSLKYMGQEFWAIIDSDVLLLDTTRCLIIELAETYFE